MSLLHDSLTPDSALPTDRTRAVLVGRVWRPELEGPSVVAVRDDVVVDISQAAPTMTDLINADDPLALASAEGHPLGPVEAVLANTAHDARHPHTPWLLAPVDLQPVKASGVTFAASLLERVIEEQAGGDATRAATIRAQVVDLIGADLSRVRPGSPAALRLKADLVGRGAWSQYLEVGLGPDAEVFTKAPPMAAVGTGAEVGIRSDSAWNNPEPELAVAVSAEGRIVGATLANDVNLRDLEGRSALLLGKAKDNNGSAAVGPFLRLLDDAFSLDRLREMTISLHVTGQDGFSLYGHSSMSEMSRDLADLVAQTIGPHHQYPDGLVLLSGTMFAPTQDRREPGMGFTHEVGDVVRIASPLLGCLVNRVGHCEAIEPWTFGVRALMDHLARRGLIEGRRTPVSGG